MDARYCVTTLVPSISQPLSLALTAPRLKATIAFLLLTLTLSACGNGGGSGDSVQPNGNSNWDQMKWDQDKWS